MRRSVDPVHLVNDRIQLFKVERRALEAVAIAIVDDARQAAHDHRLVDKNNLAFIPPGINVTVQGGVAL